MSPNGLQKGSKLIKWCNRVLFVLSLKDLYSDTLQGYIYIYINKQSELVFTVKLNTVGYLQLN